MYTSLCSDLWTGFPCILIPVMVRSLMQYNGQMGGCSWITKSSDFCQQHISDNIILAQLFTYRTTGQVQFNKHIEPGLWASGWKQTYDNLYLNHPLPCRFPWTVQWVAAQPRRVSPEGDPQCQGRAFYSSVTEFCSDTCPKVTHWKQCIVLYR